MAKKMWVWKNPNLETGEKGVIMQLRIHSYFKWKTKTLTCDIKEIKKYYNLILGEHLEVANQRYNHLFKDHYSLITDFDLWFYAAEYSKQSVIQRSNSAAINVPSMKMSAVCYLIDPNFWVSNNAHKKYDFLVCYNDFHPYKKPDRIASFWQIYRRMYPKSKLVIVYKELSKSASADLKKICKSGNVKLKKDPPADLICALYNSSKCLIHASKTESGPRVIGESMSCGTPCIIAEERWNESVSHLLPGILVLPERNWNSIRGCRQAYNFLNNCKVDTRQLVNTNHFLSCIDEKLATLNNKWTKGQLLPPSWIGARSAGDDNDRIFKEITGQDLV